KPQIEQIQQPNQRWLPSHRYNHYKTDTPTHNRPACRTLNKMLASTIQLPQQHPTSTNHNPNTGRVNASRHNNLLLKPAPHQRHSDCPKTQQCTKIHQPATRHHNQPPPTTHSMASTTRHNTQPQAKTTTTQHT